MVAMMENFFDRFEQSFRSEISRLDAKIDATQRNSITIDTEAVLIVHPKELLSTPPIKASPQENRSFTKIHDIPTMDFPRVNPRWYTIYAFFMIFALFILAHLTFGKILIHFVLEIRKA